MSIDVIPFDHVSGGDRCVKLPNGTLIKWLYYKYNSVALTRQSGNAYYLKITDFPNWPEPSIPFVSAPYVFGQTVYDEGGYGIWISGPNGVTTTNVGEFYLYSPISLSSTNIGIQFLAIGRWK